MSGCPEHLELEAAAESDPPPQRLAEHLQTCEPCRRRFDDIRQNNRLLDEVRTRLPSVAVPPPALDAALVPGFELIEEISRGGQGVVFRARQTATKRPAAVKMLLGGSVATDRQRARFHREIEIAARLRHPGIVSVFASGVVGDGREFVAMEYVEGLPLDVYLRRRWPLETTEGRKRTEAILDLIAQIASAAGHAHAAGVIHRDLKPSNILVGEDGAPRILDFGLARADDSTRDVSLTQEFVGTLAFAAPEQLSGRPGAATSRTDVYALGVLLYASLTERHPYPADGPFADVARHVLNTEPRPPSEIAPKTPRDVDTIVLKALAKEPDRRYHSASEFAADIRDFLAGRPIAARRDSTMYILTRLARKHRIPATAAVLILITVVGALIGLAILARDLERQRLAALDALRDSAVHRARLLGAAGETASAERLLWGEALRSDLDSADPDAPFGPSPEVRRAAWALAEFYSRVPRVARVRMPNLVVAADIEPGAESFFAVMADGATGRWTLKGEPLESTTPWRPFQAAYPTSATRDGSRVVFSDDQGLHHFAPRERRTIFGPLPEYTSRARASISEDGQRLAVAEDNGDLSFLDPHTGERLALLHRSALALGAPCFTPSGLFAAGVHGESGPELRLWRAPDPKPVRILPLPQELLAPTHDPMRRATTTPDGGVIAAVVGGSVAIWSGDADQPEAIISAVPSQPLYVQLTPDGSSLSVSDLRGTITEWALPELTPLPTIDHGIPILKFHRNDPAALTIIADIENDVSIYESPPRAWLRTIPRRDDPVHALAISPDGSTLLCADEAGQIDVIPMAGASSPERTLRVSDRLIADLQWTPRGTVIACGADGAIRDINIETGEVVRVLESADETIWAVDLSAQGGAVAAGGQTIFLWPDANAAQPLRVPAHTHRTPSVAFSPDGSRFASVSIDRTAAIWDARDGRLIRRIPVSTRFVRALAWSHDGSMLVTGGDDRAVRIWDPRTGALIRSIEGLGRDIFDLEFHPSGRILFVATRSPDILVIDPIAGAHLASFRVHDRLVFDIELSRDGRTLVSAGEDPWVCVWDIEGLFRYLPGNAAFWRDRLAE